MTREALLALAERLRSDRDALYRAFTHRGKHDDLEPYEAEVLADMLTAITALRALAAPPAGETPPCANGDCRDHYGDPAAWCSRCRAGETPQGEAHCGNCLGTRFEVIDAQDGLKAERCMTCGEQELLAYEPPRATPDRSEG